jgi:hypothetical protein
MSNPLPPDLIERVAKAIEKARKDNEKRYYVHATKNPDIWELRERLHVGKQHVISTGDLAECLRGLDKVCCENTARHALTEAGAWIAEASTSDAGKADGVTRQALEAVRDPEDWRMR